MYSNCKHPSHHTVLCRFHSSPFLTKYIIMAMCLVYLVSLQFFSIPAADFLYNIIRGACFGTIYVSLFIYSIFRILKCTRDSPSVHASLYSISVIYCETVTGTCIQLSIGSPWSIIIYSPVLLPVYGHSCHMESDNSTNWFSDLILAYLNRSYRSACYILS